MTSIGLTSSRRTSVQTHIPADVMIIALGWLALFLVIVELTVSSEALSNAIEVVGTLS